MDKFTSSIDRNPVPMDRPVWIPHWPKRFKILWALVAVLMLFCSVIGFSMAWSGLESDNFGFAAGGAACGVMLLAGCVITLQRAGLDRLGSLTLIRTVEHKDYGLGVRLPQRTYRLMFVLLVASAVYGLSAAALHFVGNSESLLPASRDSTGGGVVATVYGFIVLSATASILLFRDTTDVTLYAEGFARRTKRRRAWRVEGVDIFVRWDLIDDLLAETYDVSAGAGTARNPIVRVVARGLDPNRRLLHLEKPESTVVRAYELTCEPNALFALMLWCKDNPWARKLLAGPDARELLKPPPLRERFRLSAIAQPKKHWWSMP